MASLLSRTALLFLLLFLHVSCSVSLSSSSSASQSQKALLLGRRSLHAMRRDADAEEVVQLIQKPPSLKKKTTLGSKNQTKPIKPKKTNSTTTSAATISSTTTKIKLSKILSSATKAKLNKTLSTTTKQTKSLNSATKFTKPFKSNSTKASKTQLKSPTSTSVSTKSLGKTPNQLLPTSKPTPNSKTQKPTKTNSPSKPTTNGKSAKAPQNPAPAAWSAVGEEEEDLIAEFRGLPSRVQETLFPDLERISATSKAYFSAANAGIAAGVRPFVGSKFAPKIALAASALFLVLPLSLVTLVFRRLRAHLSPRRLLTFIQAYLAIYFATLTLTALATGLEPLKSFYSTSPGSYTWTQAAQSVGYLVYLAVQVIDLVVVFSPSAGEVTGLGGRALALGQTAVGLAVGMHYYLAVFHRAVAGDPPRASWRMHGIYAASFLVMCTCSRADRRKKAYYPLEGGEMDVKMS